MKNTCFKILFFLIALFILKNIEAEELDSLSVVNTEYDSILKSDHQEMNILFYKHQNDALVNNLGPFGSPFYYPTTFNLKSNSLLKEEDQFTKKLFKLSGFKPYSNITYINASRKEQHFYLNHVQEFSF